VCPGDSHIWKEGREMKKLIIALLILLYGIQITSEDMPPEAAGKEVLSVWCPYQYGSCSIPPEQSLKGE